MNNQARGTMTNIKIGDVVRLKSGGPSMTVTHTGNAHETRCSCSWFAGNEAMSGKFPADALQPEAKDRHSGLTIL